MEVYILRRALLVGYYGYGNFGDEILMGVSLDILKSHGFDVAVLYPTPGNMGDVRLIDRFNPFSILKEILRSRIVVFGGGGIFQDSTSFKSLFYYASIALTALFFGKKVILLGNGIGPLRRKISRFLVKSVIRNRKTIVFTRDPVSMRYASMFGKKVYRGTDLAVIYLGNHKVKRKENNTALIFPKFMDEWWNVARYLEEKGYSVVFSAASPEDERIAKIYSEKYAFKTGDVVDMISRSSLVVSERFHPCLIAAYLGVPFVSVGEKKTERFFKEILKGYLGFSKKDEKDVMMSLERVEGMNLNVTERLNEDAKNMLEKLDRILRNL